MLRAPACSPVPFPSTPGRVPRRPQLHSTDAAAIEAIKRHLQQPLPPTSSSAPTTSQLPLTSTSADQRQQAVQSGDIWKAVPNKEFSVCARGLDLRCPPIQQNFIHYLEQPSSTSKAVEGPSSSS